MKGNFFIVQELVLYAHKLNQKVLKMIYFKYFFCTTFEVTYLRNYLSYVSKFSLKL